MPKPLNTKIKLLYLMKYFYERTDERHPVTVKDLIEYLADLGIKVERKTVYDDIDVLKSFGMDIVHKRTLPSGYYLASRDFGHAELKLLVDAVQASKFITRAKSRELIEKLEGLTSVHNARDLQKHVFLKTGVKSDNEDVYDNIETIHTALLDDKQISFQYFEWTLSKEQKLKKNGERYIVSPWELLRKDDNYYLIGIDEKSGIVKHYRVDKMLRLVLEQANRTGGEIFQEFDSAAFAAKTFGMFGGREEAVRIEFANKFVGVVLEHFGHDVILHKVDEEYFSVLVHVNVSTQFFGWLSGLGSGTKIVSPEKVKKDYIRFLKKALAVYNNRCEDKVDGLY